VRYIVEPRKGLDYARNTGWQNARFSIVAYTDDFTWTDEAFISGEHAAQKILDRMGAGQRA
jgi:glycosyltransferase involved in cell wall biosynthesis